MLYQVTYTNTKNGLKMGFWVEASTVAKAERETKKALKTAGVSFKITDISPDTTRKFSSRQALMMIQRAHWGLEHNPFTQKWSAGGVELDNEMVRGLRYEGMVDDTANWYHCRISEKGIKVIGL